MATLIQMFCPDCDYSTDLLRFGPSFSDHRTLGPALDSETQQVVEVSYDDTIDEHVVPYTNEHLQARNVTESENEVLVSWPHRLKKLRNFCPSCNGYSLNIDVFGMAD